jgi:hypothetical protein
VGAAGTGKLRFIENTGGNKEATLRKSLILVLMAVGGGASYAAGITELGSDFSTSDPSTWRWHVSSILAEQQKSASRSLEAVGALETSGFDQRYERYSPLGRPEAPGNPP